MSTKTTKRITKNIRVRKWTSAEVTLVKLHLQKFLVDEEHNFAAAIDKLALKKAANKEVCTLIQKIFDQKRRENRFMKRKFCEGKLIKQKALQMQKVSLQNIHY